MDQPDADGADGGRPDDAAPAAHDARSEVGAPPAHDAPPSPDLTAQPFVFSGTGREYFGIWIVNVALTIVTLGVYSAWAKVRRLQYFYRNTRVAGASFDYHGPPGAILKGRLVAGAMFGIYYGAAAINPLYALAAAAAIACVMPWLLQRSLRFRLYNSSWRGLRFGFDGTVGGAYHAFLLWPFLALISFFTVTPIVHQQIKKYEHGEARYGRTRFTIETTTGSFYAAYGLALAVGFSLVFVLFFGVLAITVILAARGGAAGGASGGLGAARPGIFIAFVVVFAAIYVTAILLVHSIVTARVQNTVWNGTRLGPHGFTSDLRVWPMLKILVGNAVLTVITLGLYVPFAEVKLARYMIDAMTLVPAGPLDEFAAGEAQTGGATGDAAAEFFDIGIAF